MTVTTSINRKTYTGDASTTAFAYTFKILASTDLTVHTRLIASPYTETLQTETTHYSVSGVGDAGGGTVTMVTAPAATLQLIILRVVPQTQLTDYTANDAFPADTHEEALDRLAMIVQDQKEILDRSLKVSKTVTDLTTPEFKEPAAARAGKFLAFDGDGDELTVTDGPLADAVITSPADAHVLLYDNTDSRWENKAVSGDIAITAAGVASIASGVVVNADVNSSAAIVDTKLATISTADKVSGAAVQVDGAADGTGITIANTDKFLLDDAGTTKYVNASQVNSYVSASVAADDIGTGDAAASFETSAGAVVIDSQASTTTVDGHTGVTIQSTSSGDILLDSAADVVLDAAGNDIGLKASGTQFGALSNASSDFVIAASVEDKDILLKGDDGGSAITALALDMSDAGKATFSGSVVVTGDLTISGDDLVMATNTSGAALIGDDTNFNPVVISGDISIGTDGTAAIGSGVVVNADLHSSAGIVDTKLATITTAGKVGLAALDIDGGTEIGEAIVDADLLIIDNGAGGTNRKVLASRLKTYAGGVGGIGSNLIRNGAMQIAQRGTQTGQGATNAEKTALDGWLWDTDGTTPQARVTTSKDTSSTPTGFGSSLKVDCTTAESAVAAGELLVLQTRIEAQFLQALDKGNSGALTVVLSFWVSSPKSGVHCVSLYDNDGNRHYVREYTVSSADTWEKISVTFPGDTSGGFNYDTGIGLRVSWALTCGSNYQVTADQWAAANRYGTSNQQNILDNTSNNFYLSGAKLEVGSTATDFYYGPAEAAADEQLCYRYLYEPTGVSIANQRVADWQGPANSTTVVYLIAEWRVPMRAAPALTATAGDWKTGDDVNAAIDVTALSLLVATDMNALISVTVGSGLTQYRTYNLEDDGTAGRIFLLSAEL